MTVVGVHEQYQGGAKANATTPAKTLERYPLTSITREFAAGVIKPQNLVPKLKTLCGPVWAEGLTAAISFKFSVAEVFNRQWLPYIQQAADYVKSQGQTDRTVFVIWHEAENDFRGGGKGTNYFKDAADFVSYFNIAHDMVKSINPGLLTCHAALGYAFRDKGEIGDQAAQVLATLKADLRAIDIYSGRSFKLGMILPELSAFKRWYRYIGQGRAWAVTERGWMADTPAEYRLRADTIRREADWLQSLPPNERPVVYIAWLTEGTENDPTLKPDPLMTDAINYLLRRVNEIDVPEQPPVEEVKETDCPLCMGRGKVAAGSTYTIVRGG